MTLIMAGIFCGVALSGSALEYEDAATRRATDRKGPTLLHRAAMEMPGDQLRYARSLRDKGKYYVAGRQYLALVHSWHHSAEAPQAQVEYAQMLEGRHRYEKAFEQYQYLIDHFKGGFAYDEVLDRQFRIANRIMTTEMKFLVFFTSDENLRNALPMFRLIVDNGPNWSRAAEAQFNVGLIQERLGEYRKAIGAYEIAQQKYARSGIAPLAMFRKGYCLHVLAAKSPYDEHSSQVARAHLQRFVREYPDHESAKASAEYVKEINARLAGMYYDRAVFYDKRSKRPRAALIAYTDFVSKFPGAETSEAARSRIKELSALVKSDDVENAEPR